MQTSKHWTVIVEEDPNDPESSMLPFPQDMLDEVGWKEGDTLVWEVKEDRVYLTKK